MLLTKTVKMKWNNKIKKHYESKGYIFIKQHDEFEVKVGDLLRNSSMMVVVICDSCNKELNPMTWQTYLDNLKDDNKYYCRECAMKLYAGEKIKKSKLKNSISFQQWCYDNLSKEKANEILSRWDYDKNIDKNGNVIKPSEVSFRSTGFNRKGYWFKCDKHIKHKSELKDISNFVGRKKESMDCSQCNSIAQYLIDNYSQNALDLYWDYEKNKNINPWKTSRSSTKNKIWIKCQGKYYHESYEVSCSNFSKGKRCPYCVNQKVHPLDSLGQYIIDNFGEEFLNKIWSDKNNKSAFKISPKADQYVWWKCPNDKHEDYKRKVNSSNNSLFRCPYCMKELDNSLLQEKVKFYLCELGYNINHENQCTIVPKNPKTKQPLPFDNEVVELKLIIEVHGEQHYKIAGWTKMKAKHRNITPEQELHYQQLKDRYKRIYAKHMKYEYLEIPYWTEKDESYKDLINNKIKEILDKQLNKVI